MTLFRPCIDIHESKVKQIVGSTLRADPDPNRPDQQAPAEPESTQPAAPASPTGPTTNFVSDLPPAHFAGLYRSHGLAGAHVIMLGPGNDGAAAAATAAWPGALQVGGGITPASAAWWVGPDGRAGKVIVTSYVFPDDRDLDWARLGDVFEALGRDRRKLVVDLSCVRAGAAAGGESGGGGREAYFVATKKWTVVTEFEVNLESLCLLAPFCSEFLVHAVGVEGLQSGVDTDLVAALGDWAGSIPRVLSEAGPVASDPGAPVAERRAAVRAAIGSAAALGGTCLLPPFPVTYAGGARSAADLDLVHRVSAGRVDLTIGSALDIFGGKGVSLAECVAWNREHRSDFAM